MSQDFHFYKVKIFNEEAVQMLERSNISNAIKAIVEKEDLEGNEKLKEVLFEEIEVSCEISGNDKRFEKALKKVEFLENSRYFIIEDEIFKILKVIIEDKIKENRENKLEREYSNIKDIFDKKLLVANLF